MTANYRTNVNVTDTVRKKPVERKWTRRQNIWLIKDISKAEIYNIISEPHSIAHLI